LVKPRILVIRGGAIGDFILTLPAIRLLREAFPAAHLEILGYKHIVAIAEGRFYADATRSIEYAAMAGFFVPNSELAADLAEYFASFQQIISYLYDPSGFFEANLRRAGAKQIIRAFAPIDDSEHATRQLARPLQSLALYLEDSAPVLHPTAEDRAFARNFLHGASRRPLIALHPGSGSPKKNWPIHRWIEVANRLRASASKPEILLILGEADEAAGVALQAGLAGAHPVHLARDLPLPQLAAVLAECNLFLGHDSGISHLAAAAGTPSLVLFGPTDPAIWAPANDHVNVFEAPAGDLARISVDEVLSAALAQLEKSRK
jgi:heptosyltransferase-2